MIARCRAKCGGLCGRHPQMDRRYGHLQYQCLYLPLILVQRTKAQEAMVDEGYPHILSWVYRAAGYRSDRRVHIRHLTRTVVGCVMGSMDESEILCVGE